MDTDIPSQEGREDVPSELSFASAPRETNPMPIVTRPSETARPESTSVMVTRSRAREGRGISVVPEVQIEPEIETRPEQEIATCEGALGAARPSATDTAGLFRFADRSETVTAHTSQEVTDTSRHSIPNHSSHRSHSSSPHKYLE